MKNICKSQKDCSMSESCIYDIDNKWRCGTFFSSINIIRDIMTNLGVGKYTGPPNVWMEFIDTGYIYNRIDLITIIFNMMICLLIILRIALPKKRSPYSQILQMRQTLAYGEINYFLVKKLILVKIDQPFIPHYEINQIPL